MGDIVAERPCGKINFLMVTLTITEY